MSKGWYGNKMGHSLASRGIRTEIRKHRNTRYERIKERMLDDEINNVLANKQHNYNDVYVNPILMDSLYYHFKDNKEQYGIDEVKTLITPSSMFGIAKFYIRWDNGNITEANSLLFEAPIERAFAPAYPLEEIEYSEESI